MRVRSSKMALFSVDRNIDPYEVPHWFFISKFTRLCAMVLVAYCGRYIFRNFIYKSQYVVPQWRFIDIQKDDLE